MGPSLKKHGEMVILLTATVNAGQTAFVARRDPRVRLNDYVGALNLWLRNKGGDKLVLCENSSYPLNELQRVYQFNNPHGKAVEFLSFAGTRFNPQRGKGPGELEIIEYALGHSRLISGGQRIMKVTGRLYVKNADRIIETVNARPEIDIVCDLRANLTYGDSRVFCATPRFFTNYLLPLQHLADDSRQVYFEHILGRAVHGAMADGINWAMMPTAPDIRGVSGSGNVPYGGAVAERLARRILHTIKSAAIGH